MNNTFHFLRHAETSWDRTTPPVKWILSERGKRDADQLALSGIFNHIAVIIASCEEKAFQTALPIAERLGKEITSFVELNDLYKGESVLEGDKFFKAVESCLKNPRESLNGWETASRALERSSTKIDEIDSAYDGKNILIVSHGCVLSLYFARTLGKMDEVYERWRVTPFCARGIIKNGKVVKDIVGE
jgi:broad specificity phosphatase PhoE